MLICTFFPFFFNQSSIVFEIIPLLKVLLDQNEGEDRLYVMLGSLPAPATAGSAVAENLTYVVKLLHRSTYPHVPQPPFSLGPERQFGCGGVLS